ncbi:MAG: hypothetical protein R2742_02370 [Micropruina glycogenica]
MLPYSNALESGRNLVASVLASVFTVALLWLYLSFVERRTLSFTGFRFTKLSLAMFGVGALASAACWPPLPRRPPQPAPCARTPPTSRACPPYW